MTSQANNLVRAPPATEPLVGREAELRVVRAVLERARNGWGQVLGLTGESGIGKSRLAIAIDRLARPLGFDVHRGACRADGTTTAYLVWQPVWRGLFNVDPALTVDEQQTRLAARIARHDGGSSQRAPLLGPLVGLPLPDSELTASLDPQVRTQLLGSLLLDHVRACATVTPLLIVLEDCHWTDPASQDLLDFLAPNVADLPVLILVTRRPAGAAMRALTHLPHFTDVRVADLPPEDAKHLVAQRIRSLRGVEDEVPDEMVSQIVAWAGGNPFHVEELVRFLLGREADPRAPGALVALDLPNDPRRLVLARAGQLGQNEKAVIETASVLGSQFPAAWIWGSDPTVGTPEQVLGHLEHLADLQFLRRQSPWPPARYAFKHAITREAIYESLDRSRRERLHQLTAEFIEHTHPDQLSRFVDVLAHHYRRTPNAAKQRVWFRAAAEAAKTAFAASTAIGYYEDLIVLAPEEAGKLLVELGDLHRQVSGWEDAERVYERALWVAELTGDRRVRAEANRGLGSVLQYTRSHGQALQEGVDRIRQAVVEFEELHDGPGLAKTLERLAWMSCELGDYQGALDAAARHRAIAAELDDPMATSAALQNLGVAHWHTGNHAEALVLLQEALQVATGAGYRPGVILAANDLAGLRSERGDHVRAIQHFQHALSVAVEIGDRRMTALAIGNIGESHRRHGEYGRASRCFAHAFRTAAEIGDRTTMAGLASNLAMALVAQGHEPQAEELLTHTIRLARHLNAQNFLSESLYQHGSLLAAAGRLHEAERANREALEIATERHHSEVELRARLLSLRLQVDLGRVERGTAIRELRRLRDTWVERLDQAPVLDALLRLDPTQEQVRKDLIRLYQELYAQDPNVEYREAYEQLTGRALPRREPLPSEPDVVRHESLDLPWILEQLDLASGWSAP